MPDDQRNFILIQLHAWPASLAWRKRYSSITNAPGGGGKNCGNDVYDRSLHDVRRSGRFDRCGGLAPVLVLCAESEREEPALAGPRVLPVIHVERPSDPSRLHSRVAPRECRRRAAPPRHCLDLDRRADVQWREDLAVGGACRARCSGWPCAACPPCTRTTMRG